MSDVIRDADECVKALEKALEAMHPPIDVYEGILCLIAEFVSYGKALRRFRASYTATRLLSPTVRFDTGSGLAHFSISDDGLTATRNGKDSKMYHLVCASPSFSTGKRADHVRYQVEGIAV